MFRSLNLQFNLDILQKINEILEGALNYHHFDKHNISVDWNFLTLYNSFKSNTISLKKGYKKNSNYLKFQYKL